MVRLQQSLLDYFRMLIGTRGICRIGTGIVLIVGRISFIRQNDGVCIIGVKLYSTTMGMAVDFSITLFLTFAFVWPIWRSKDKARKLARNSIIAALAALCTTVTNLTILAVHDGKQRSFVCLGSCVLDATANAAVIFFVTRVSRTNDSDREVITKERSQHMAHAARVIESRSRQTGAPAPHSSFGSMHSSAYPAAIEGDVVHTKPMFVAEDGAPAFAVTPSEFSAEKRAGWTSSARAQLEMPPDAPFFPDSKDKEIDLNDCEQIHSSHRMPIATREKQSSFYDDLV